MKKIEPKDFVPFVPTPTRARFVDVVEHAGKQYEVPNRYPGTPRDFKKDLEDADAGIPPQPSPAIYTTAMIELPIVEELPLNLQVARHIDINLSRSEAVTLRRLLIGAQDGPRPVKLRTGRFVQNSADVVRLFLEKAGGEK